MDTNAQSNSQGSFDIFLTKLEDKKIRFCFNIPSLVIVLFWILFMALPIAKIMYFHPENVSVLKLTDYKLDSILPLLYSVLILLTGSGSSLWVSLLKKDKTKVAVALSIVCGVLALIFAMLLSFKCDDIILSLEELKQIRVDKGAAGTIMEIAGYVSAIYNVSFGVIIALLKNGKIKFNKN